MAALTVDIDPRSGFCGGVIRAIRKAEECLDEGVDLYSLGAIVHNEEELQRLSGKGLHTVGSVEEMIPSSGGTLLIRAHGEPPSTYRRAAELSLDVVDCTCPVVLKLQQNIREAYLGLTPSGGQVIIFGKVGHAEVLGLLGQTDGNAVIVESAGMLEDAISSGVIHLHGPLAVFSQTTKSPSEYRALCSTLLSRMQDALHMDADSIRDSGLLVVHDTICAQVASRHEQLLGFATSHDLVIFVSGKQSSNGKVLFDLCRSVNERTYHIGKPEEISPDWIREGDKVGICGATSTPRWLLESVAAAVRNLGGEGR